MWSRNRTYDEGDRSRAGGMRRGGPDERWRDEHEGRGGMSGREYGAREDERGSWGSEGGAGEYEQGRRSARASGYGESWDEHDDRGMQGSQRPGGQRSNRYAYGQVDEYGRSTWDSERPGQTSFQPGQFGNLNRGEQGELGQRGTSPYGGGFRSGQADGWSPQYDEFGTQSQGQYRSQGGSARPGSPEPQSHAGKGPRGWKRSDERIRDEVNEALARHPAIDASDLEVKVQGGEVTLTGTVEDRRSKRLAEDVAEQVFGVSEVQNQVRVKRAEGSSSGMQGDREVKRAPDREGHSTGEGQERSRKAGSSGTTAG